MRFAETSQEILLKPTITKPTPLKSEGRRRGLVRIFSVLLFSKTVLCYFQRRVEIDFGWILRKMESLSGNFFGSLIEAHFTKMQTNLIGDTFLEFQPLFIISFYSTLLPNSSVDHR